MVFFNDARVHADITVFWDNFSERRINVAISSRRLSKPAEDGERRRRKTTAEDAEKKFEMYYNFTSTAHTIQAHQVSCVRGTRKLVRRSESFFSLFSVVVSRLEPGREFENIVGEI